MRKCYVCEELVESSATDEKCFCSSVCETNHETLSLLANAIENNERKPRLTAYSDLSLFEPVDLGKLHDEEDEPTEEKYVLPVVIEALPTFESGVIFLVKLRNGRHHFAPKKKDAIKFYDVEAAKKYIAEELKPRHGESFNFVLWSESALVS